MVGLSSLLAELGVGVASNAIYDAVKSYFAQEPRPTRAGLEQALEHVLVANGATVRAATVIDILAKAGAIVVNNSRLYAPDGITIASRGSGQAFFGGTGVSETDKTAIRTSGAGTGILSKGNAAVRQNADGSISFHTGPDGSIGFFVGKD